MKVSNGINITHIYQEQLKKAQSKTNDNSFSKLLDNDVSVKSSNTVSDASALKHAANANLNNLAFGKLHSLGKAEPTRVDPEHAFKHAVEVFTSPEAETSSDAITREAKVAHIKELYDSGQYSVSPEAVAERLWASRVGRNHLMASWE